MVTHVDFWNFGEQEALPALHGVVTLGARQQHHMGEEEAAHQRVLIHHIQISRQRVLINHIQIIITTSNNTQQMTHIRTQHTQLRAMLVDYNSFKNYGVLLLLLLRTANNTPAVAAPPGNQLQQAQATRNGAQLHLLQITHNK